MYNKAYGQASYPRCAAKNTMCSAHNSGCGMQNGGMSQEHSWGAMNPQCATAAGADNQNVYNFGNYLQYSNNPDPNHVSGVTLAKYNGGAGCGSTQDLDSMFPAVLGTSNVSGIAITVAGSSPDIRVGGVDSLVNTNGGCTSLDSQYGKQTYGSSFAKGGGYGVSANLPC
jgi:hypothetical protein